MAILDLPEQLSVETTESKVSVSASGNTLTTVEIVDASTEVSADSTLVTVQVTGSPSVELLEVATSESVVTEIPATFVVVADGLQGPPGMVTNLETGPAFTYSSGRVSRIDYDSGNYKTLTYSGEILVRLDYFRGTSVEIKLFIYNPDGTLSSIENISGFGSSFTYSSGRVSRIDYSGGSYKTLVYSSGVLTSIDYFVGSSIVRKVFLYNPDGTLSSIEQTVF